MVLRSARSAPRAGRKRRVLAVAALLVCVLAACAPGPRPESSGSASATSTPSTTAAGTPAPAATITLDSPMADAPVTVPVTIKGTASTADSKLVVDLLDADGQPLCVRHITATPGSGSSATWQTDLAFEPPDAEQDVTLRAYTQSAADGSAENIVERPLTLTAERPPIIITSPGCGDTVAPGGTLTVVGRALVPEAQFTLELRDASGAAVLTQDVMAADGTQESDFSATLDIPAGLSAGFYDLVGFDNSLKDGSEQYDFPVQLLVQ
ncbi:Gmad2 immunoglobulin-like domain-containing protein [Cryobacterium sp. PAMC25264]|uniref:Gmad2 immunoglobulin-like domain-containing protein n=1 Tax=Cryobacterium sp. PAMC25264 TaxID=2861288 RepID=UPI001C626CEB|nr:Gmad2 immunoglobulin-like domain-containing protein [Cryobacterium sp. PAMC25264]QYF73267.1 Gmad2 immunoglobulin-like domain-containing protein [Cryobacterium sp. PAMC25264]